MALQGPWTWFNEYLKNLNTSLLTTDTFKAILCSNAQSIDGNFVGGSGNCTYADLTAELATASGYTNGGLTLTSLALTRSSNVVKWDADDLAWTISATINVKYVIIRDVTTGKLVCFSDLYTDGSGANLAIVAGPLQLLLASGGILNLTGV